MKNTVKTVLLMVIMNIINALVLLTGVICMANVIKSDIVFTLCSVVFMVTYGFVSVYEVVKIEEHFRNKK